MIVLQGVGDDEVVFFFDEGQMIMEFVEGVVMQVVVNCYECDCQVCQVVFCLYGCWCQVCGLDMVSCYGEIGQGFIYIYYFILLVGIKQDYCLNFEIDLILVCFNCYVMLYW